MKQYECKNICQVAHKIAEMTNTILDKDFAKYICNEIRKHKYISDSFDYFAFNEMGDEYDCSIWIGYDINSKSWLLGIDNE